MSDQPNLLFVFGDQWRRHAVGCMNADPVLTPRMDQFAREGMLFENALSCSPLCTPNRAALLTGKHPFSLGMMHNWLRLPVEEETIAKAAARHGYNTGYIGKWHLDAFEPGDIGNHWNHHTPPGPRRLGFDFWYSHGCNHRHFTLDYMRTDGTVFRGDGWQLDHETDVAIRCLEQADQSKPFCLFLSWSLPHNECGGRGMEFVAPERFAAPYRRADLPVRPNARGHETKYREAAPGYFGSIASMDENFGRLLDALDRLGLRDNTIVALSSDHGEMLQSQGRWLKDIWYEESIGIPFIIRWPGQIPAGRREPMLLNTPDMMPSLLGLMGCEIPAGRHGRDYSPIMRGQPMARPEHAFLALNSGAPEPGMTPHDFPDERGQYWRGVRSARYTYAIVDGTERSIYHGGRGPRFPDGVNRVLFDNEADPYQMQPIYQHPVMDELHDALRHWLTGLGDDFLGRYYR